MHQVVIAGAADEISLAGACGDMGARIKSIKSEHDSSLFGTAYFAQKVAVTRHLYSWPRIGR
jgi:hypothetical protein